MTAILREGVPLLNQDLVAGVSPVAAEPEIGRPRGFSSWLFSALTGISLGEPASFLTADLPLARSSYAPDIIASGRLSAAGAGSGGTAGSGSSPGTGAGTGTSTSGPLPHPGPLPQTGVPEGDVFDATALFRYYGGRDPLVAIVHSHGSESFLPVVEVLARAQNPQVDVSTLDSFTSDKSANMIRVGEELARYLATAHGIPVVQARSLHDLKEDGFRLGAYRRSLDTMTAILRDHPRIKVLLDLHRDAPGRAVTTATLNGTPVANILVIVGSDRLLENPHWEKNYAFARRLVATMEEMYPGLSRGILVRDERYNQHLMERTLLLEIGGQENTLDEVFLSVRYLGEVLARLFAEGFE
jgi:stage II sporulation protein P